jgi:hypothetical protein
MVVHYVYVPVGLKRLKRPKQLREREGEKGRAGYSVEDQLIEPQYNNL